MCLKLAKISDYFRKTATEDITVYKVYEKSPFHLDIINSPYKNFPTSIGEVQTSDILVYRLDGRITVGIHSFPRLEDAYRECDHLRTNRRSKNMATIGRYLNNPSSMPFKVSPRLFKAPAIFVYECIIPKGSKYYTGIWEDSDNIPNIVSNTLIVQSVYDDKEIQDDTELLNTLLEIIEERNYIKDHP